MKDQLATFREEISKQVTDIRQEVNEKVSEIEEKQEEISDVQSILDCRVDKLEGELRAMKDLIGKQNSSPQNIDTTKASDIEIDDFLHYQQVTNYILSD